MIELFNKGETTATFRAHSEKMIAIIKGFSDEKILTADFDEWAVYFVDEYKLQPIALFMDNITQNLSETTVRKYNHFSRHSDYEPEYYQIDGYKITFSIPFDGDSELLYLKPSTFYMSRFPVESIVKSTEEKYGKITFTLEYTKQELQEKENAKEFIESRFSQEFKTYIDTIEHINQEVESYNKGLEDCVRSALENRKKKANDFVLMGEKLDIPLKLNPNAPNITPIAMKKATVRKPEIPKAKPLAKQYQISSHDYDNIKRIIHLSGTSMEKTARTFAKFSEEELRDVILSNLNTHYQGIASAETFSKVGKTDIHIQFENKAAYIGECKIWHGEKNLLDAIKQLFSYTTWRDAKTSIIIFNKDNKDFCKLLKVIENSLSTNPLCKHKFSIEANEWICEFLKDEHSSTSITVQLIVFDLFV